jgi:sulfide:quinone oxidoreductase
MKPVVVSDVLAVGELPTSDQIEILAKAGFKSILNNQPDGEVSRFPTAAALEGEARQHGLSYAYVPLSSRTPPDDELARYEEALKALPAPIYAFCYSGARSAAACALLLAGRSEVNTLIKEFAEGGYDLEGLRPWLEERGALHAAKAKVAAGEAASPPGAAAGGPQAADSAKDGGGPAAVAAVANGNGAHAEAPAAAAGPTATAADAERMPRTVVVQPRAHGFGEGGFAM